MRSKSQDNARTHKIVCGHAVCNCQSAKTYPDQQIRHGLNRRRRPKPALTAVLPIQIPPLQLDLPEDAYDEAPACWWSRARWVAHNLALYDQHYTDLRAAGRCESVGRKTFELYLLGESAGADYSTGRNSRVTIRSLQTLTRRSESTMHRCRRLVAVFGTRTVVFRGRQRTLLERLDSWRRDDRARGWAAVSALHESPLFPVDNALVESILHQGFGTPPGRSSGSLSLSRSSSITPAQNVIDRRASRGMDTKRARRKARSYDPRALLLASRCRSDERFPLWVRQLGPQGLAAVLTRRAINGWTADDVHAALDQVYLSGRKIFDRPRDPYGYLAWLLKPVPVDEPPMLLDRARERTLDLEQTERDRAHREQLRAEAMAKVPAAPDSPMRAAALAVAAKAGRRAISTTSTSRAAAEAAQRELARLARDS
ncbi:hypothetical protein ACFVAV_33340 [Nocardia sp. NPDC057663]|uniref:hypothetical protein n=1 Tax=Nocardia sp. NPDC057663 TaxID=3346201 RepID=UPI00366F5C83